MQTSATQSHSTVILQDEGLRKLKGFVQIPRAVLMDKRISFGAKVAYGVLLGYAWQDNFCFPAQQALADDLACSVRQARRLLSELKDERFITWEQKGLNQPNVYYLLPMPAQEQAVSGEEIARNKDGTNMSYPERTNMSGQDGTYLSAKVYSSNNTHKTVNGSEKDGEDQRGNTGQGEQFKRGESKLENPIRLLPVLDQPKEKTQDIAKYIFEKLNDPKGKKFHLLVAGRIPEIVIKTNVGEILEDGADDPGPLFTWRMMEYAKEQLVKSARSNVSFSELQDKREQLASTMHA